jgi:peptide chain release factor 2
MKRKRKGPRYNVVIPEKDLRRDTMRAGGPGGQHQNKTESAVRYTHIPTGIAAESRSERSQHANDTYALELLREKLLRLVLLRRGESTKEAWRNKPDPAFGAKMRSYVLDRGQRVIDHATGWRGEPSKVLNGGLDGLLVARLKTPGLTVQKPRETGTM